MRLPKSYYLNEDTLFLARDLLGKVLYSAIGGEVCSGIICETEAYCGVHDKASHAYGGLRSRRTETMYSEGGVAYVYLCYGIHNMLNIVTHTTDIPHAILIRGIKPLEGTELMRRRRGLKVLKPDSIIGPGKVAQALGIDRSHDMASLLGDLIWIEDQGIRVTKRMVSVGPRIGVDYAGEDAFLPYRFRIHDLSEI